MKLGSALVVLTLALGACAKRAAVSSSAVPSAAPEMLAAESMPPPRGVDPERERRVAEFLAPGRGETAAQGSLPPGLDTPMSKESALLVHRCDLKRLDIQSKVNGKLYDGKVTDTEQAKALMAKELRVFDPRCADLQRERDVRTIDTGRDVAIQQRIVMLAEAIANAPPTCKSGAENPSRAKPPVCWSSEPLRWDTNGWSCIYEHVPERLRSLLDVGTWSFTIDAELGTYEVVAASCYHGADRNEAWTELVIRGRLGEKPRPEHFFRRAAVTD